MNKLTTENKQIKKQMKEKVIALNEYMEKVDELVEKFKHTDDIKLAEVILIDFARSLQERFEGIDKYDVDNLKTLMLLPNKYLDMLTKCCRKMENVVYDLEETFDEKWEAANETKLYCSIIVFKRHIADIELFKETDRYFIY